MIKIENITKVFDNNKVLNNVSFSIENGEIISLVGHNGSGKTTLLKIISGLLIQNSGEIFIDSKKRVRKHRNDISMLLEGNKNFYSELTLYQNIRYFYGIKGFKYDNAVKELINYYLSMFNLVEFADKPIYKFSRGMQQKTSIILSFVLPSQIILLDEPTLGLDIFSVNEFESLIKVAKAKKKIVIITSHQLDLLQRLTDKLLILHKGDLIYNSKPKDFLDKYAPITYRVTVKKDYYKNVIEKIEKRNIKYKISSIDSNELIIPSKVSLTIGELLEIINADFVDGITKSESSLEDAYINFWNGGKNNG